MHEARGDYGHGIRKELWEDEELVVFAILKRCQSTRRAEVGDRTGSPSLALLSTMIECQLWSRPVLASLRTTCRFALPMAVISRTCSLRKMLEL